MIKILLIAFFVISHSLISQETRINGFYIGNSKIIPEVFQDNEGGDVWGISMVGVTDKSKIDGHRSKNNLPLEKTLTLFVDKKTVALDSSEKFFSDFQSPDDFVLVKLNSDKKDNTRWIKTANGSARKNFQFMINKNDMLDFEWVKMDNGFYKINPSIDLGHYAFIFNGKSSFSNNHIFTFTCCFQ